MSFIFFLISKPDGGWYGF